MTVTSKKNPLWKEVKVKNYLPHMTVPEVETFLTNSDLVIIPIGALEQHSSHLPIGTDFINGVELCKLIAQERDILVAPVLMAGQSPYHMAFPGTITLSAETILKVHIETVESLVHHGFKRFIFMNSHGGNRAITTFLVDQINQKTAAVAVDYSVAITPFLKSEEIEKAIALDRHAGTGETSDCMYLMPSLVEIEKSTTPKLKLPEHLQKMLPEVINEETTAKMLFLAEGLKAKETGKKTSTKEMTETGVWGEINPNEATLERGEKNTKRMVEACSKFIDKWNELARN
ncbi:creatininase family protein [Aureibaculum sp. A20]|uniref:Creatininase family protein n=1 Tax=Aureibaculum flavum TaxID=2795986 RepID=A0ABS0WNX6_9FLAO|nr:creatininase family protein [Aureibaculum flavum]MBJ2173663.1 creatininase family protein [Aureibaculum flavum]